MKISDFDFLLALPFVTYFDEGGEGISEEKEGGEGTQEGGEGTQEEKEGSEGTQSKKSFTQDEVNNILKRERKKVEDRTKAQIKELEDLKKSKSITEQDRTKLQTRIEALQDELLTKEQLAAKEQEKLRKTHEHQVTQVSQERDTWKTRYHKAEISRAISDASSLEGAFSSEDIASLLEPKTQLVEELDDAGEATGRFVPKVKYRDTDKEGKAVTLDLTVHEAVKRMKDTPERYGYLFKSTANSGLGMDGGSGRKTALDVSKMSPEQYREYRKKNKGK